MNLEKNLDEKIEETLDIYVRPYVKEHGGEVRFHYFREGCAYLSMHGACEGCASIGDTLYYGIETILKLKIPEVNRVELIDQDDKVIKA